MALDPATAADMVAASVDRRGVVATWEELICPVLDSVGRRWARTGTGVEVEHLLSEAVTQALARTTAPLAAPRNARPVLLAAAPGEEHTLPLRALAAALAERGVATRVLGARLPHEALVAAIRRSGPAVVFVWAHLSTTADTDLLSELPTVRPAPAVIVGGPGWDRLPPGVARVSDLAEAVAAIARAVGV
jgi:methanogenic corrinoid protein MtbC1